MFHGSNLNQLIDDKDITSFRLSTFLRILALLAETVSLGLLAKILSNKIGSAATNLSLLPEALGDRSTLLLLTLATGVCYCVLVYWSDILKYNFSRNTTFSLRARLLKKITHLRLNEVPLLEAKKIENQILTVVPQISRGYVNYHHSLAEVLVVVIQAVLLAATNHTALILLSLIHISEPTRPY